MTYQLKKERGGPRPERTYEFTAAPAADAGTIGYDTRNRHGISANQNGTRPKAQRAPAASRDKLAEIEQKAREARARDHARMLEEAKLAEQERNIRTVRAAEHTPFPAATLFAAIVCTVLFMFIIINMVKLNEEGREVVVLRSNLAKLQTQITELSDKLEQKNDLRFIEEYAVNTLGMVKTDQLSKQYVSLAADDKIELVSGDEQSSQADTPLPGLAARFKAKLEEFREYIS